MTSLDSDLSIENLCFSYPEYPGIAARELFSGLNLQLSAGSTAVVLARPDQGKTTLCRVLAGLLPRFSGGGASGQVCLGTVRLLEQPPYDLIEQVGLVFQHPGEQLPPPAKDTEVVAEVYFLFKIGTILGIRWLSMSILLIHRSVKPFVHILKRKYTSGSTFNFQCST